MGTFVTANPHVPLPADRTDNPAFARTGAAYELDASHINDTQNAVNDLHTHTRGWVNVASYGTAADGVTDDLPAFQAAYAAVRAKGGGVIFVPKSTTGKLYRLSAQWLVGVKFVNEWDVTSVTPDYTAVASYDSAGHAAAAALGPVSVVFEPGAGLWGDFTPTNETALVYYGICNGNANVGMPEIVGGLFVGKEGATAGVRNVIAGTNSITNKQTGVFAAGAYVKVHRCKFEECRRALVMSGCFWAHAENIYSVRSQDALVLLGVNAMTLALCRIEYAHGNALVLSGQGCNAEKIRTEECASALWVVSGDNIHVSHTYLEDTDASHADYLAKFGVQKWKAGKAAVADGSAANAFCTNDGGKLYQCITAGTTAGSGGPTGTGADITDNTAHWKYVSTIPDITTQVVYGSMDKCHGSTVNGGQMLLAGSAVAVDETRIYTGAGAGKVWLDDTQSSLSLNDVGTGLVVDGASTGAAAFYRKDSVSLHTGGGLKADSSAADLTGAGLSGLQLGSENIWYDPTTGAPLWRHGTPSTQHDGNAMAMVGNQVNWTSFPSTANGATASKDVSWTGALGDHVSVVPVTGAGTWPDGVLLYAYVRSANTIRVVLVNNSGGTFNPGSFSFQLNWAQVIH